MPEQDKIKSNGGRETRRVRKHFNAQWITTDKGNIKNLRATKDGSYPAVAIIGDRFWNEGRAVWGLPEFCLAEALERDWHTIDNTFHNLDHGDSCGNIRLEDVVGINKAKEYDKENKRGIMEVIPGKDTINYQTWKGFLDLCQKSGKNPNVSIEAWVTEETRLFKEIKELLSRDDLVIYSNKFDDDQQIRVEVGYEFDGVATVKAGAGGDECSIDVNSARVQDGYMDTSYVTVENKEDDETVKSEVDLKINVDTKEVDEAIEKVKELEKSSSILEELEKKCLLLEQEVLLLKLEIKRGK